MELLVSILVGLLGAGATILAAYIQTHRTNLHAATEMKELNREMSISISPISEASLKENVPKSGRGRSAAHLTDVFREIQAERPWPPCHCLLFSMSRIGWQQIEAAGGRLHAGLLSVLRAATAAAVGEIDRPKSPSLAAPSQRCAAENKGRQQVRQRCDRSTKKSLATSVHSGGHRGELLACSPPGNGSLLHQLPW